MVELTYEQAVEYIQKSSSLGSKLGLDRVRKLCELLGSPHEKIKCIHIAGTNGKGSTGCFITSILKNAGIRTGFYYSPAMNGISDHYMVDGQSIPMEEYAYYVSRVANADEELYEIMGERATQFELETAIAFLCFEDKKCELSVIETGLGGAQDATNISVLKELCIFTSISYDHTAILGNTLTEIASVKSGIITNKCPVIVFKSCDEVVKVITEKCNDNGNEIHIVDNREIEDVSVGTEQRISYGDYRDISIALRGVFQRENAAIAIEAANVLKDKGYKITQQAIYNGIGEAYWPYRLEKISSKHDIYIDGAHNPDAAWKLMNTLEKGEFLGKKRILVLGMFKDKEYEKVISTLVSDAKKVYCITTNNPERALSADDIRDIAGKYISGEYKESVISCSSIEDCVHRLQSDVPELFDAGIMNSDIYLLATGSLSYLDKFKNEIYKYLR